MSNLICLTDNALNANHPVFQAAGRAAKIIFVWDEEYFREMNCGFKQLVFIYETLCEMTVEIYQGKFAEVLESVTKKYNIENIYIPKTPNHLMKSNIEKLNVSNKIHVVDDIPFVDYVTPKGLKKFFNYWGKVRDSALRMGKHK